MPILVLLHLFTISLFVYFLHIFFFSPVNSSFVTLFVQIRSIYRLKRHLLLLFSIPFSSYLSLSAALFFIFFFSDFGAALHIVHLCTILHCLCIRHCLYMSSKYVLFFFILFFCRAFSRMLDFLIFRSSQLKREKVKQQQQKLIAKIFNYSVFGGSESAWKFIFVVQLFAWV